MTSSDDFDDLHVACRDLYRMARSSFILPPMIRQAASPESGNPRYTYVMQYAGGLRFAAEFDRSYVENAELPLDRLPLRFVFETLEPGARLRDMERAALIRAFLLGVRMPISIRPLGAGVGIFLQLSETYFFDCGRVPLDLERDASSFYDRLASELLAKSEALFVDARDGLALWRSRVEQQFLNRPSPDGECYWPDADEPSGAPLDEAVTATAEPSPQDSGPAGQWLVQTFQPYALPVVLTVASSGRRFPRRAMQFAAIIATGLITTSVVQQLRADNITPKAESIVIAAPTPVNETDEPLVQQASLSSAGPEEVPKVDQPIAAEKAVSRPDAAPTADVYRTRIRAGVAAKISSVRHTEDKRQAPVQIRTAAHPRAGQGSNPIAALGKAMKSMTSNLTRNLQKFASALTPPQQ
jgi:hypothetical protein